MILPSHRALQAGVKPTQVGRELRKRCVHRHVDSRKRKQIRRPFTPMLYIEKCTRKPRFSSQAHFAFSHRGRVAKGISECPDRLPQHSFYVVLAFLNLAACFRLAA